MPFLPAGLVAVEKLLELNSDHRHGSAGPGCRLRGRRYYRILRRPVPPTGEGTVNRTPIRGRARRIASVTLIAAAVSLAAAATASAATHVNGIQGTGK